MFLICSISAMIFLGMDESLPDIPRKGRGAVGNPTGRFEREVRHAIDDGWEPYWRNGVIIPPGKTKHAAFVAESPGKWAIHDDILEHEAGGLATWFEVV